MGRTKKNKNKRNDVNLNVFIAPSRFIIVLFIILAFVGVGLLTRHCNSNLENQIKKAETEFVKLSSIVQGEKANLNSKQNTRQIKEALRSHGRIMTHINSSRCYVTRLDKNKAPTLSSPTIVAYNNK
ncbi:MAG: hypothetical protein J6V41_00810 [Kiritimatiellae bacterium]|nr:hypothetical protein [Kiritimatiellia bacterium]